MVVERDDLGPVGVRRVRGVGVDGVDRGLQLVGAGGVPTQAPARRARAFGDHGRVPRASGPGRRAARARRRRRSRAGRRASVSSMSASRPDGLRLVGHQLDEHAPEPDRLGGEVGTAESSPPSPCALGEDEVEDARAPTVTRAGRSSSRGTRYGMPAVADLGLGAGRSAAPSSPPGRGTRGRSRASSRPPSSRRVSATCASRERAGWQQVKTRRSRSSFTGPSSSGPSAGSTAWSATDSAWRASRWTRAGGGRWRGGVRS